MLGKEVGKVKCRCYQMVRQEVLLRLTYKVKLLTVNVVRQKVNNPKKICFGE